MKNFVLIWNVNEYPEMGGGIQIAFFESINKAEEKVNEITKDENVSIYFCGEIKKEIVFEPIEKVTIWKAKDN
jgi:hypothetical protein